MISEETITKHLHTLLSTSDPGDMLHHMHVVALKPEATVGPLGFPDEADTKLTIYAIAYGKDDTMTADEFIMQAILSCAIEHESRGERIIFAGLSQEFWTVDCEKGSEADELGWRLQAEGRLRDHPDTVEATAVYAACADGRRWRGLRWVTGPKAGTVDVMDALTGPPLQGEEKVIRTGPLLRRLVGIR